MIEIRWLIKKDGVRKLQWRPVSKLGVYSMNKDCTKYGPTDIIHEWKDVPVVEEE